MSPFRNNLSRETFKRRSAICQIDGTAQEGYPLQPDISFMSITAYIQHLSYFRLNFFTRLKLLMPVCRNCGRSGGVLFWADCFR